MTEQALAAEVAEAAAIAPLPSIFDAELADARRHCRYDSKAVMRASSETVADKAAYLEWIGDTQLTNHLGRLVWQLFPNASSRFAHQLRTRLLSNATLSLLAVAYDLPSVLVSGPEVNVLRHRKLYANALEATIGAAYCSGNHTGLEEWADKVLGHLMQRLAPQACLVVETVKRGPGPTSLGGSAVAAPAQSQEEPAAGEALQRPPNTAKQILMAECKSTGSRYEWIRETTQVEGKEGCRTSLQIDNFKPFVAIGSTKAFADHLVVKEAIACFFPDEFGRILEVNGHGPLLQRLQNTK